MGCSKCGRELRGNLNYLCIKCYRDAMFIYGVRVRELREYYNLSFKVVIPYVRGWALSDVHYYMVLNFPDIRDLPITLDTILWFKLCGLMHSQRHGEGKQLDR